MVWYISSYIGLCFPLAGGLGKFYANAGGKQQIQCQLLLVQYKQQANPLLSLCVWWKGIHPVRLETAASGSKLLFYVEKYLVNAGMPGESQSDIGILASVSVWYRWSRISPALPSYGFGKLIWKNHNFLQHS